MSEGQGGYISPSSFAFSIAFSAGKKFAFFTPFSSNFAFSSLICSLLKSLSVSFQVSVFPHSSDVLVTSHTPAFTAQSPLGASPEVFCAALPSFSMEGAPSTPSCGAPSGLLAHVSTVGVCPSGVCPSGFSSVVSSLIQLPVIFLLYSSAFTGSILLSVLQ
ncbi:MAG: hypothetical protein LBU27_06925 [Candidatus Peribacteria bacterium]|jgi:hypothetical protein|nr:hypothetical protein [Candidatus Peribacteria bacterium]